MVVAMPSSRTVRPRAPGSAPNCNRQTASLTMTTGAACGTSSAAVKSRPSAGCTPSIGRKFAETMLPVTTRGSRRPERWASDRVDRRHRREGARARLPVHEVRMRDAHLADLRRRLVQHDQASGRRVRQRAQQHAVNRREHRRRRACAEREGQDRRGGEPRRLSEDAGAVAEVLHQRLEPCPAPRLVALFSKHEGCCRRRRARGDGCRRASHRPLRVPRLSDRHGGAFPLRGRDRIGRGR